jgi:hypothetical protein
VAVFAIRVQVLVAGKTLIEQPTVRRGAELAMDLERLFLQTDSILSPPPGAEKNWLGVDEEAATLNVVEGWTFYNGKMPAPRNGRLPRSWIFLFAGNDLVKRGRVKHEMAWDFIDRLVSRFSRMAEAGVERASFVLWGDADTWMEAYEGEPETYNDLCKSLLRDITAAAKVCGLLGMVCWIRDLRLYNHLLPLPTTPDDRHFARGSEDVMRRLLLEHGVPLLQLLPWSLGADHYEVLGISRDASQQEIRQAYRARSLALHPDKAGPGATKLFHRISEAYHSLLCETSTPVEAEELKEEASPEERNGKFTRSLADVADCDMPSSNKKGKSSFVWADALSDDDMPALKAEATRERPEASKASGSSWTLSYFFTESTAHTPEAALRSRIQRGVAKNFEEKHVAKVFDWTMRRLDELGVSNLHALRSESIRKKMGDNFCFVFNL